MRKLFALILSLAMLMVLTGCDSADYKEAVSLYECGKYAEAVKLFEALDDYKDSADMFKVCNYHIALELTNAGKYQDALSIFSDLGDYEDSASLKLECEKLVALTTDYDNANTLAIALLKYYTGSDEELALIESNHSIHYFFQEENDGVGMYQKIISAQEQQIIDSGLPSDQYRDEYNYISNSSIYDLFDVCNNTNWFWRIDAGALPLAFDGNARLTRSSILDDIKSKFKDPQSVSIESARFAIVDEPENGVYAMPMEYVAVATVRATNSFGGYVSDTYLIKGNVGGRANLKGKYMGIDVRASDIYYNGKYYYGWPLY